MKHLFLTFTLILTVINSFCQFTINSPFERKNEYQIHKNYLNHTQIKPYDYLDSNINKKIEFDIKLLYNISTNYDVNNKNLASNIALGFYSNLKYKNVLKLNIAPYWGFYKPETFLKSTFDSLHVISNYGEIRVISNGIYHYANFLMNLSYKPADFIRFEIGNGKTFIGDGYRSLLRSDYASANPYFRTIVEVWKVKYLYLIEKQSNIDFRFQASAFKPKYTFTHYLSFNIGKFMNISAFETVITTPYDSLMANRGIELNYLNPVIFFRSVEITQGSPDNVLVGFTGNLKLFKSAMIYGQVFIDEFILSHIKSPTEYWDEKYGIQAGLKSYNTLWIKNLYTQFEVNAVRPFTYSHLNPILSYTNKYQPLTHPLGANFQEGLAIIGYSYKDFMVQAKAVYARYGENDTLNYGRNLNISYTSRLADENILWLQGISTTLKYFELMFGYTKWNTNFSLSLIYRTVNNSLENQKNIMPMLKISTPLYNQYLDWN